MVELGRDGDLAQEPLGAKRVAELRMENLDSHRAVVLEIAREEDSRHAALAELALDVVAVGECGGESGGGGGHSTLIVSSGRGGG